MTQTTQTPEAIIAAAIMSDRVNEMLDTFGLNWKVSKEAMTARGQQTQFFALCREDKPTLKPFAAVPDSYQVYQNYELAELLVRICEKTDYTIYNGGEFGNGAKVYMQLKVGERAAFGKNEGDRIESLATALNYHNYNGSTKFGHTDITISCGNTFNAVDRQLKNTFRHTSKMHEKIEQALQQIDGVRKIEAKVFEGYERMAGAKVTQDAIVEVAKIVTGVDMSISREELERNYKTVSIEKLDTLLGAIQHEMDEKGETLYGLFNGVTYFTSHLQKERKEGARNESKYLSTSLEIDNKAFSKILSLA